MGGAFKRVATDGPPRRAFAFQDWDTGPGGSPTTAAYCLRDAIESGFSDFVLHFGDIAYAEATGTDWEHWSRQNEALASRVPCKSWQLFRFGW